MASTADALDKAEEALDKARRASPLFAAIKEKVAHEEHWARIGQGPDLDGAKAALKHLWAPIDATEAVKPFVEARNAALDDLLASSKK